MNRRSFFVSLGALPIVAKGVLKAKPEPFDIKRICREIGELEQKNLHMIRQVQSTQALLDGKAFRKALLQRQQWSPSQLR